MNDSLVRGITCPNCGLALIDLEHDGYESGDADNHDYFCTKCGLSITINTSEMDETIEAGKEFWKEYARG